MQTFSKSCSAGVPFNFALKISKLQRYDIFFPNGGQREGRGAYTPNKGGGGGAEGGEGRGAYTPNKEGGGGGAEGGEGCLYY